MPTVKYGRLYMKDANGDLVQIMPAANSSVQAYQGATSNADGVAGLVPAATSANKDKFLRGDGTWAEVSGGSGSKEIKYLSTEPDASNTSTLDNESIIFAETSSQGTAMTPVFTAGNQTIAGTKTFLNGIFGGVWTMGSDESAIDLSKGTCFVKTVSANTTFSFANVPSDCVCCITLALINGGNYSVIWPSSLKWSNGITPSLTQNGKDILTLITYDGGTTWFGTTTCVGVSS